jgi:protein-disulfide isomerase
MKQTTIFFLALMAFTIGTAHAEDTVLATINNTPITESQIQPRIKNSMMKIMAQTYDIKRDAIDEIIDDKLIENEAKKQGLSTDALLKKEVESKVVMPTDDEARAMYEVYKKRFGDKPFEEVSATVKGQLANQKKQKLYSDYIDSLRKNAQVSYKLERPSFDVSMDDDAHIGPLNAPVKVIEFTDFQCPFCKKARPNIKQIVDTYKDKVVYVLRDFPLSFHKQAKIAANAAQCAGEQGKYFEFANQLWDNQGNITDDKLKEIATNSGIDVAKFQACSSSNKFYKEIDKDQADGMAAGVSGTPAYFVNGKFLSGAQPFESFQQIIDEELAKKK